MTIDWSPNELPESPAPRYRSIADALAADIASGQLPAGARLPTLRALADRLGVTVGTVSRAYQEVARLGLVRGEVGRGSFVQSEPAPPSSFAISDEERPGLIDLSANFPRSELASEPLRRMLEQLAQREQLSDLLEYQPAAGSLRHRTAGARWVERAGLASTPDQIVVTSGAQHGLMLAFSVLTSPGDLVLSAAVTYPGMTSIARMLRLRLEGLPVDRDGIRAESFERACEQELPKALFCMPTLQNPTAVVMPERRRREIARVAERFGVTLVEDDTYGFLPSTRPAPLSCLRPEDSYYISGLSKCVAPGLRVGYLRAPAAKAASVSTSLRTMMYMAPPLTLEIATRWIEDGTVDRLIETRRREARDSQKLAARLLDGLSFLTHPESYHLWLQLPPPWRAEEFCTQARARGVGVLPAESFAVGRSAAPHAIRISISAARSRQDLERGLRILAELASAPPAAANTFA